MPPPGAQAAFERWSCGFFTRPGSSVVLSALTDESEMIKEAVEKATPEVKATFNTGVTSGDWFRRRIKNHRIKNRKVRISTCFLLGLSTPKVYFPLMFWLVRDRRRGRTAVGPSTAVASFLLPRSDHGSRNFCTRCRALTRDFVSHAIPCDQCTTYNIDPHSDIADYQYLCHPVQALR